MAPRLSFPLLLFRLPTVSLPHYARANGKWATEAEVDYVVPAAMKSGRGNRERKADGNNGQIIHIPPSRTPGKKKKNKK